MKAKKSFESSEPLLSVVARKIGHAAGALAKVTQELTGSIPSLPEETKLTVDKTLDPQGRKANRRSSSGAQPRKKARKTVGKKTSNPPLAKRRLKSKVRSAKKH